MMPIYIEACSGRLIPASLALYADGQPKPGVSVRDRTLKDGDRISFDPFLMDSASGVRSSSAFLTNAAPREDSLAAARAVRDAAQGAVALSPTAKTAVAIVDSTVMAPTRSDPRRTWQNSADVHAAKAVRDTARAAARY